jgi:hypothetical protein
MYTKSRTFISEFQTLNKMLEFEQNVIKNETMFFNSSIEFAYESGETITKNFIDNLPSEYHNGVFDSRVHMLMPGWFPAIPGYHHDDVDRPTNIQVGKHFLTASQPDYDNQTKFSKHILALINGNICPTKFIVGKCTPPIIFDSEVIYKIWHNYIIKEIEAGNLLEVDCPSNQLIQFDCNSFHTASCAISDGWRWFGRVSIDTNRQHTITNEIRKQVQVYMNNPMQGW